MNPKAAAERILELLEGKTPNYEGNKALINVCRSAPLIARRYLEAIHLLTEVALEGLDPEFDYEKIEKFLAEHSEEE